MISDMLSLYFVEVMSFFMFMIYPGNESYANSSPLVWFDESMKVH